jgi:hypothetical protein
MQKSGVLICLSVHEILPASDLDRWVEWNRLIFHLMLVACRHPVLTNRTDL